MDGICDLEPGDPGVVICVDEFGPLNLQPPLVGSGRPGVVAVPGRAAGGGHLHPPHGVRHLLAAYDLSRDKLSGHSKPRKRRGEFRSFCRSLGSLSPLGCGSAWCWTTPAPTCRPARTDASARGSGQHVELAHTPTNASYLNGIEGHFAALRYLTLDGTDHPSHAEQASMIRRYITWPNRTAHDRPLCEIVNRANAA
jgi:hypothetical protein